MNSGDELREMLCEVVRQELQPFRDELRDLKSQLKQLKEAISGGEAAGAARPADFGPLLDRLDSGQRRLQKELSEMAPRLQLVWEVIRRMERRISSL